MRFCFAGKKCFADIQKGLAKTFKMMYNVSNTYYTTLFSNFQEEMTLFLKKEIFN